MFLKSLDMFLLRLFLFNKYNEIEMFKEGFLFINNDDFVKCLCVFIYIFNDLWILVN